MNKNKQRIVIAEACGWTQVENVYPSAPANSLFCGFRPNENYLSEIPYYLNDLDSMHEAVSIFDYGQADEFDDHLCDICKRSNDLVDNPTPWRFAVTNATASQRAEAFLKTLNLWEE